MAKTIGQMTAEVREYNIAKGWRPADGGPGENTFGDYIALLHSEIGEATDAYRKWRLADATYLVGPTYKPRDYPSDADLPPLPKPEGVGAELADVLIRLLSACDVFGIQVSGYDRLADVHDVHDVAIGAGQLFGDHMAWLHFRVSRSWLDPIKLPMVLRMLVTIARKYGIDLDAEYERKMTHNWTRPYHHGGTMAEPSPAKPRAELMPRVRLDNLRNAMPTDPRDWWTGEEVDEFLDEWRRLGLPRLAMSDGQGDTVVFWCADMRKAASMLGVADPADLDSFDVSRGEYTACIVQADDKE